MFVESFQGQFNDGTNGTCDFRMVSASFLILRIVILFLFLNLHRLLSHTSLLQGAFIAGASCIHAITRPYKLNFMNNVDIVILFLLEILIFVTSSSGSPLLAYFILGTTLLLLIPHMIMIFYICHKLVKKIGITQCFERRYKTLKRCMQSPRHTSEAEADVEAEYTGSLPNRLINPGEYEPLLPTTEEHTAAELTEDKEAVNEEPRRLIPVYNYNAVKQYCVF